MRDCVTHRLPRPCIPRLSSVWGAWVWSPGLPRPLASSSPCCCSRVTQWLQIKIIMISPELISELIEAGVYCTWGCGTLALVIAATRRVWAARARAHSAEIFLYQIYFVVCWQEIFCCLSSDATFPSQLVDNSPAQVPCDDIEARQK